MTDFKELGLREEFLKILEKMRITEPTEIQEKAVPLVLQGKDIIAGSATGSGKTLAFSVGLVQNLKHGEGIKALILTPTRELAEQVSDSIKKFSEHKKLEITPIYGGVSVDNQAKQLTYTDIIVATPGRLLDHLERNNLTLEKVDTLILDEADRMWDMGFQEDVGKIVKKCTNRKQNLLFSATISKDLESFSKKYMDSPIEISAESHVDPTKLKQVFYDVPDHLKFSLLAHLLKQEHKGLIMVFCNTRRNTDFVEKNLKAQKLDAHVLHGGKSQSSRLSILKKFHSNNAYILVCTDVAARGLDIKGVSHVYNYDLPSDTKDYVHRIGRTARAGEEGMAINILASRDYDNFYKIERAHPNLNIERKEMPYVEQVEIKKEERRPRRGGRDFKRGGRGRQARGGSRSSSNSSRRSSDNTSKRGGSRPPRSRNNNSSRRSPRR